MKNIELINKLILKSKFIPELGLFTGKIGITITLFELFKKYHNRVFEELGLELIANTFDELTNKYSYDISFGYGLSGIGWGIEYLIYHGFFDNSDLDICSDIDNRVYEYDPRRISDFTIETGLEGLIHYIVIRFNNIDPLYKKELYQKIISSTNTHTISNYGIYKVFLDYYETNKTGYKPNIYEFISKNINNKEFGIENGISGTILKSLL
ncbi:MAG: hypothetical protein PEPC_01650 [Peptostreptococcus russellii]